MDGTCDLYPVQQVPRVSTNLVYPSTMSSTRTEYIPNRSAYDFEAAITLTVKRSRGYSISIPGTEIQGSIIDPPTYNYRIYSIPPWEALEVWTTTIQIDSICDIDLYQVYHCYVHNEPNEVHLNNWSNVIYYVVNDYDSVRYVSVF